MWPTVMLAQTLSEVHFAWQAQHFGNLRYSQVQISWQAQHFRKSTDFVAGAALSQGQAMDR